MGIDTILYFGSFNPVHRGHIAIADNVLEQTGAKALWFIVSPQNPFKQSAELAPERDRLEMAKLALKSAGHREKIQVSDIEFGLPKPNRTVETLRQLDQRYPQRKFALLIGSDNADGLARWKCSDEILDNYPVLVYPREGYTASDKVLAEKLIFLDHVPLQPYAATDIRKIIAAGEDNAGELTPAVWDYIKKHRLYGYIG